jgi:DNA-binding beta-propeller fold protein YncE
MIKKHLRTPGLGVGLIIYLFVVGSEIGAGAVGMNAPARPVARQGTALSMAIVVNGGSSGGISFIDPVTDTATGPFLEGALGPATDLLDGVVTPDGTIAIVSNFSAWRLYFIDVGTLTPSLLGSVSLPIPAEDLALTPDGRFVLVTDGSGTPGFFTPIVLPFQHGREPRHPQFQPTLQSSHRA